jgi:hypothetical protein
LVERRRFAQRNVGDGIFAIAHATLT